MISLRTVVDGVNAVDGIANFQFTPELFSSVRSARSRYRLCLEETKQQSERMAKKRKSIVANEELVEKCSKLKKMIGSLETDADNLSLIAETKSCFTTLAKANSLRKTITEKKKNFLQLKPN